MPHAHAALIWTISVWQCDHVGFRCALPINQEINGMNAIKAFPGYEYH
ncbi:MAG: hypothetical protein OXI67_09660 [Candidatus Poribacteria bacterium]|nr:hypothetical protein [Candidatus Poribacteria bacterium]